MKFLGAGLSRTGTASLHRALGILGFRSLHYDESRLNDVLDGSNAKPDFRRYDDLDAVTDIPTAWFYEQLLAAYPECRCILTVRDENDWWRSVQTHFRKPWKPDKDPFKARLRNYIYGSVTAHEFLFRKRYREHNERVMRTVPRDRLLVMNIPAGDGWEVLCPFVGWPAPPVPFPRQNRGLRSDVDHPQLALAEIESAVPAGDTVIVVDQGWLGRDDIPGRERVGLVARDVPDWNAPPDEDAAILGLEARRGEGATFLVLAVPVLWWLDTYWRFHHHLRTRYRSVVESERLVVFDLRAP